MEPESKPNEGRLGNFQSRLPRRRPSLQQRRRQFRSQYQLLAHRQRRRHQAQEEQGLNLFHFRSFSTVGSTLKSSPSSLSPPSRGLIHEELSALPNDPASAPLKSSTTTKASNPTAVTMIVKRLLWRAASLSEQF